MLPVFFWLMLSARSSLAPVEYYRIFYEPIESFSSWITVDRSDRSKDIFLARYRLPLKGRGAVLLPVAPYLSAAGTNVVYLPVHVDIPAQRTITFVLDGAEKGTLAINGERKGFFDLQGVSGYVEVRVSFAAGVYSLLFSIEKRRADLPLLLIADQPVTLASRGFTKNFSVTAFLSVREFTGGALHERLWTNRCIPAPDDSERSASLWREVFGEKSADARSFDEKTAPLLALLKRSTGDRERATLLKAGFTDEMLAWWRERLSWKEVCRDVHQP